MFQREIETEIDRPTKLHINKSCLYVCLTLNDNKGHHFQENHNLSNSVHVLMVPEVVVFMSNSIESVFVISERDSSKDIQVLKVKLKVNSSITSFSCRLIQMKIKFFLFVFILILENFDLIVENKFVFFKGRNTESL